MLFDAFWWKEGPVSNKQIVHRIVLGWLQDFPEDEMVLAVPNGDVAVVQRELGPRVEVVGLRFKPQGVAVMAELGRVARRSSADVILAHNFTPFSGKSAVFIQDVLFMTNPNWFTRAERLYFAFMPLSARRAVRVLSSSSAEAERIDSNVRLRRPAQPVGLAPNPALLEADQVKPHLDIERNAFVLTVGRLNVRKNLERVCQAALLSKGVTKASPLVVAGGYQGKSVKFSDEVQQAVREGRILLAGNVTDNELAWLYANTSTFVFASLDEGFGLPPVEALAFGAPVVASDIPVMRENLGPHAVYVSPTDVIALAAALEHPNRDDGNAEKRIAYARSQFSWTAVVARIRSSLVDVIAIGKRG